MAADSASEPQPQPQPPDPEVPRHVVFRAGGTLYALPLESVREVVVPRPPFARVPRAPPAVRGAMNLRGRVVAIVELAAMLPSGAPPPGEAAHVIVLDRGRRALGFLVGPVLAVEALLGSPIGAQGGGEPIRGTATRERQGSAVQLLDPDVLEARATALFAPV